MSKVVLVTGASTGLGYSIADYLAGRGYTVYGTSRSIKAEGQKFIVLPMNVCNEESVQLAIKTILNEQGRIDVVINNAGIGIAGAIEHLKTDDVQNVFDTNVLGVVRVCQAVLPAMRKQKSGKIINISSISAEMGLPYRGAYSASKAALDRISEAMRMELKKFNVQICTVQPGGIQTDINANRVMSPLPADSPYKASFERTYQIINDSVSKGLKAEVFGPEVEKIMNSEELKRNYRIGKFTEKLAVVVKRLFSASFFENTLIKHYKV